MLCRRCEALSSGHASKRSDASHTWGAEHLAGVKCTLCGSIFDADDVARLVDEKFSQLAQFGLVSVPTQPPSPSPAVRSRS